MKNSLYIALLLVVMLACKKDDSNQVPAPAKEAPVQYNYTLTIINEAKSLDGDTIRVRLNDVIIPVYITTERYQHATRIKSGDVLSVYYNPGQVQLNGSAVSDENDLRVYLDDKVFYEASCRCVTNVTKKAP